MKKIELLDCTLRDGAYVVEKKFGDAVIYNVVNGLTSAKIDFIEIGFLQDEGMGEGKTVYFNSKDAEKYIPKDKEGIIYTVLADYSRYSIDNLDEYTGKSFDAVRACFFKNERKEVLSFCEKIKEKGYKLFVQPVDVLGYSDIELLDLISDINKIEPYCFSVVDTFGSMYEEELERVFYLLHNNLISTSKMGFHSHNNLQMSSALSQAFIRIAMEKRDVVIDCTLSGMGRGAGNTPTELIVQFLISKFNKQYNLDAILDVIDSDINRIHSQAEWGYNISYFVAGSYSAHVNNISYLLKKNSIMSKDIRYILNCLSKEERKRYNYDLLDNMYLNYLNSYVDDNKAFEFLYSIFEDKDVLIIAPGNSVMMDKERIASYIAEKKTLVISINYLCKEFPVDYIYMNNQRRYSQWKKNNQNSDIKMIITSNLCNIVENNEIVISILRLIKCGWQHMDNSAILLLRLLNQLNVNSIGIAGLDGYNESYGKNYIDDTMEILNPYDDIYELNDEIDEMLQDFMNTKKEKVTVEIITNSRFSKTVNGK